jgi:hypothetical protein
LIRSLLFVLLGLLIIALAPKPAKAELSPQQFQTLKSWAEMQDYPYQGLETCSDDSNHLIYYWRFGKDVNFALVLTSVSSLAQAEAAFQASQITNQIVTKKYLLEIDKQLDERKKLQQQLLEALSKANKS